MQGQLTKLLHQILSVSLCVAALAVVAYASDGNYGKKISPSDRQKIRLIANGPIDRVSTVRTEDQFFAAQDIAKPGCVIMAGAFPGPVPLDPAGARLGEFIMTIALSGVELTDEQVEQLAQIKRTFMDNSGPNLLKMHSLERDIRAALLKPDFDPSEVVQKRKQLSAQRQIIDDLATDALINTAKLLSAEQRSKLKVVMDKQELMPFPPPPPHFFARP